MAAIDEKQRVVWGIGNTPADALHDARCEYAAKAPGIAMGKLTCVPLQANTPLELDGEALFGYCVIEDDQVAQLGLGI